MVIGNACTRNTRRTRHHNSRWYYKRRGGNQTGREYESPPETLPHPNSTSPGTQCEATKMQASTPWSCAPKLTDKLILLISLGKSSAYNRTRRICANSPTMPRRKISTQTTKIAP
jgi:hypothetical protein